MNTGHFSQMPPPQQFSGLKQNGAGYRAMHPPPHSHRQQYQTPTRPSNQLNPTVSGFQPIGNEMQRYQQSPPSPPQSPTNVSPAVLQLQQLFVQQDARHFRDMAALERMVQDSKENIQETRDAARGDVQKLEDQVRDLKEQVKFQKQQEDANAVRKLIDTVKPMPQEWVEQYGEQYIADAYLDEAEDYEKSASKLRHQAEELLRGSTPRASTEMKLLLAPEHENGQVEFRCCFQVFSSLEDMWLHIQAKHGLESADNEDGSTAALLGAGSAESTPTHIPQRRARRREDTNSQTYRAGDKHGDTSALDKAEDIASPKASPLNWQPRAVTSFPSWTQSAGTDNKQPVNASSIDPLNIDTFSWELLNSQFGGSQWSPGFYFIPDSTLLPNKSYWLLEGEFEPYLPASPGYHGAKLTAFFNATVSAPGMAPEEENYNDVPVFIRKDGKKDYLYFGHYSQSRFSDKLDYDRLIDALPAKVRQYWADMLADNCRPDWVTKELMQHFWPKPEYEGPLPSDYGEGTPTSDESGSAAVTKALKKYAHELKIWVEKTRVKASCLCSDGLMEAFENSDADMEPGLRLHWEYLQCVRYDQSFYEFLLRMKHNPKLQLSATGARSGVGSTSGVDGVKKYTPQQMQTIGGKIVKTSNTEKPDIPTPAPAPGAHAQLSTPSSNTKGGTKMHCGGQRPWEKDSSRGPAKPNGDLAVAKELQRDFKNGGQMHSAKPGGGGGRGGNRGAAPPHVRGRR